jgi:hypothetical protein
LDDEGSVERKEKQNMFDYSKTLLNGSKKGIESDQDETRSIRSEFDYENNKKLLGFIGN